MNRKCTLALEVLEDRRLLAADFDLAAWLKQMTEHPPQAEAGVAGSVPVEVGKESAAAPPLDEMIRNAFADASDDMLDSFMNEFVKHFDGPGGMSTLAAASVRAERWTADAVIQWMQQNPGAADQFHQSLAQEVAPVLSQLSQIADWDGELSIRQGDGLGGLGLALYCGDRFVMQIFAGSDGPPDVELPGAGDFLNQPTDQQLRDIYQQLARLPSIVDRVVDQLFFRNNSAGGGGAGGGSGRNWPEGAELSKAFHDYAHRAATSIANTFKLGGDYQAIWNAIAAATSTTAQSTLRRWEQWKQPLSKFLELLRQAGEKPDAETVQVDADNRARAGGDIIDEVIGGFQDFTVDFLFSESVNAEPKLIADIANWIVGDRSTSAEAAFDWTPNWTAMLGLAVAADITYRVGRSRQSRRTADRKHATNRSASSRLFDIASSTRDIANEDTGADAFAADSADACQWIRIDMGAQPTLASVQVS